MAPITATAVSLSVNGIRVEVDSGSTVLDAARAAGVEIPTLCRHDDLGIAGNCRICLVELAGSELLQASCALQAVEGMEVLTNTARLRRARRDIISLLMSEHNDDCLHCRRSGNCELQDLAIDYAVDAEPLLNLTVSSPADISSPALRKDDDKCVRCQRCVRTCAELQGVNALAVVGKGSGLRISTFMNKPLHDVVCTACGQCVNRCPTGALTEQSSVESVWAALDDPGRHVVVQTAPAVRVAIGEGLGEQPGKSFTGRMVTALKRMGFDRVFDTGFTADLTIMEEGTELLQRLRTSSVGDRPVYLPMFSSCSPGWIKYAEHEYPELLPFLSTCKSPQQMFGALAKTYYARSAGIDPSRITVVSVMPCTAKKFEMTRPEMTDSGFTDVDFVLTTRELDRMIEQAGIDFTCLDESVCDSLLGTHTGAAVLFGATGGVMEAALRTAYELITGRSVPFENLDIIPVRGMDGVKEAAIPLTGCRPEWGFLEGIDLKVAVAHGLTNARKVVESVLSGESDYHFVEIMACPGGCLGGGGQPIPTTSGIRRSRMDAVYTEDGSLPVRKSHENPEVGRIYEAFLGEPGGDVSHSLLHTTYSPRERR